MSLYHVSIRSDRFRNGAFDPYQNALNYDIVYDSGRDDNFHLITCKKCWMWCTLLYPWQDSRISLSILNSCMQDCKKLAGQYQSAWKLVSESSPFTVVKKHQMNTFLLSVSTVIPQLHMLSDFKETEAKFYFDLSQVNNTA